MTITTEQLVELGVAEDTAEEVAESLNEACGKFGIDSELRVAGFISQCAHESRMFTCPEENLNYRADTLQRIWSKHFDEETAAAYAHHPQKIANRAYANRMGNGDEDSGDGWTFHGRGFIQLTGHDNYQAFGDAIGEDVLSAPEEVAKPRLAALSAAWFWHKNGLNRFADAKDVVGLTQHVNGGTVGLKERQALFSKALDIFGE